MNKIDAFFVMLDYDALAKTAQEHGANLNHITMFVYPSVCDGIVINGVGQYAEQCIGEFWSAVEALELTHFDTQGELQLNDGVSVEIQITIPLSDSTHLLCCTYHSANDTTTYPNTPITLSQA